MKNSNYIREPIVLFQQIKKNKNLSDLLRNLKSACPKNLNIGIAIKTGDCFFDSVAQGLNELNIKPGHRFTAKSLRKDCADYARANGRPGLWVYEAVIKDAGIGGYFAPLEGPHGPIQDPKTKINITDKEKTFDKYLENIKSVATGAGSAPIWGRPGIEGRMICDKYKVELYIFSIEEDSQKVTVTKITASDDDPDFFIEDENLDQLKIDNSKKAIGVVNYMRHFVPLLSGIPSDITESQPVSSEEILGASKEVPPSDQPDQKPLKERTDRSIDKSNAQNHEATVEEIYSKAFKNTEESQQVFSKISEDMRRNQQVSSEEILGTDKRVSTSNQSEQKIQQEGIDNSASEPVHADTVITISHQQGQKHNKKEYKKN